MARQKKDPQLNPNPDSENNPPVEKKKPGRKKKTSVQEEAGNDATAPQRNTETTTDTTNDDTSVKPEKETAKRRSKKEKATAPQPEAQEETVPAPEKAKPAKKTAKPKAPVSEETTQQQEPVAPPSTTKSDVAHEVVEQTEPVTVAEEKNEAVVHRLVHHGEVGQHQAKTQSETEETVNKEEAIDIAKEETKTPASTEEEMTTDANEEKAIEEVTNTNETKTFQVTFIINYYTKPGQSLYITAEHPLFGNGDPNAALPMQFLDSQHWTAELTADENELTEDVVYHYLLKEEDGSFVHEGGRDKKLTPSSYKNKNVAFIDAWDFEGYYDNAFFTKPFTNVLFKNNKPSFESKEPQTYTHLFKVKAPLLVQGQAVCLTGSADSLMHWNTSEPLLLNKAEGENDWQIKISVAQNEIPVHYKYGIYNVERREIVQLENGDNRVLSNAFDEGTEMVVNDGFIRTPDNTWKGAGVVIPVFSLRSENSFGCGEFTDIKKLVDWSKSVGLQLVQLLPVNDTTATKTWVDSYPYASISAFALHAMYLNLEQVAGEENKHLLEPYKEEAQRLNALPEVDYEAVNDLKWKIIHELYPAQKETTLASEDYKAFFQNNQHWLVPYAAFCCLRDANNTADFTKWKEHKTYDAEAVETLLQSPEQSDRAGMYYFVQYHLHLQLKAATEYAHSQGMVMKGDIPIGIARNSADTWQHPQLFHMDMQAGAPPDPFAVKGQNWSFPTYNWQQMKQNGFAWWKQRLQQMSHYFDAFRIDHILGFFRIWSIPLESVEGIMGHFVPALPVHIDEFAQWNIHFDYNRYCKPFINDHVVNDFFGDQQQYAKDTFLNKEENNTYSLKPEVNTQKRAETWFALQQQNERNNRLKQILFDLISNVILFEEKDSNGQLFHFRFGMEKTASYQHLDDYAKTQLYYLSLNYFYERQNEFWRGEAMQKLPVFKAETNMLICGEDLGLVPTSVPRVMQDLGLLSLEVQRMPKNEQAQFTNLAAAPYLSVVMPSTHDMSTIRGWWEEDRTVTQNFYNHQLGQNGEAPFYCEPWINKQIIEQHLYSPAMWSIFQWQDLMGIDGELRRANPQEERINVPANPHYYWNYRMHITLEELAIAEDFNSELKEMVKKSGR